jgi:hypothetical protein
VASEACAGGGENLGLHAGERRRLIDRIAAAAGSGLGRQFLQPATAGNEDRKEEKASFHAAKG